MCRVATISLFLAILREVVVAKPSGRQSYPQIVHHTYEMLQQEAGKWSNACRALKGVGGSWMMNFAYAIKKNHETNDSLRKRAVRFPVLSTIMSTTSACHSREVSTVTQSTPILSSPTRIAARVCSF